MTYAEYKESRQNEFNTLPIFFAFSMDQFAKAMHERGLTENDTDKVASIGAGGFYLKSDAPIIKAYLAKEDPLDELMKDYDFAKSAIYYEMCNHEYGINWEGDWDVLSCFGNVEYTEGESARQYMDKLGWADETKQAFYMARVEYFKQAEQNDWF